MEREILHVDVNNAFLSWLAVYKLNCGETLDIRTIPAIIGGDEKQRHGTVRDCVRFHAFAVYPDGVFWNCS